MAWIKRASLRFNYKIMGPGEGEKLPLLVTGFTVHGCVDESGKIKPLPAWVAPLLKPHLEN